MCGFNGQTTGPLQVCAKGFAELLLRITGPLRYAENINKKDWSLRVESNGNGMNLVVKKVSNAGATVQSHLASSLYKIVFD